MNNFKISIITVVYNGVQTIEQAIQSIQQQKCDNIEYIIVDGESTDGTNATIKKYGDYIDNYICEPDKGIYDAMNKGIRLATGDIIAFLNSDDWYEFGTFTKVQDYFNKNDIEVLIGRANLIQNDRFIKVAPNSENDITVTMPCCHQAVFAKRTVFKDIGDYNINYKICADYDWLLRAYYQKKKIMVVDDALVNYRVGGVSSRQESEMLMEFEDIAKSQALRNRLTDKIEKIEAFYQEKLTNLKKEKALEIICKNDIESIRRLFDLEKKYYIWGTGLYGAKCYSLFVKLGLKIEGFIDNNCKQIEFEGYPVIVPSNIQRDKIICISSIQYEKEILEQIVQMGIEREEYFCFSELIDYIWKNFSVS